MTPVRQDLRRFRHPTIRLAWAVLGVLLLVLVFLPARDPATHGLSIEWRPPAPLAFLMFLVAVAGAARPRVITAPLAAHILGGLAAALALLNLVDAATPTLLGRDLNLYWDLPHLPSLFGLAGEAAGFWRMAGVITAIAGAIVLLINGTAWAWRQVLPVLADRRIALGFAVLLGVMLDVTVVMPAEERPLATGLALDIVRQSAALVRGHLAASGGGRYAKALDVPAPPRSNLAGLKRRDVYLVYLESYGTTVFDTPEFRAGLSDALSQFETSLRSAGYTIASNRLVSPTFGGGSWLAHATLASGVRLDDPVLYTLLLDSGRKLLPAYFKDAGWRTLDIAPGIKAPSAKATAAWGFDREIFADQLDYKGPSFGWFAIPDQFTLDRAMAIRSALGPSPPVFTQLVLVSSHIPFAPVPPYLTDWDDSGSFAGVSAKEMEEAWRQPDWTRLAPDYLNSLRYDFAVLAGWLTQRMSGAGLVILLGDHQPPAIVGGLSQPPWTVPIHVLSRDPELVAPFLADGYVSGLDPTQAPPHPGMETFLAQFLAAFERPGPS
jgi:hypothetical protein